MNAYEKLTEARVVRSRIHGEVSRRHEARRQGLLEKLGSYRSCGCCLASRSPRWPRTFQGLRMWYESWRNNNGKNDDLPFPALTHAKCRKDAIRALLEKWDAVHRTEAVNSTLYVRSLNERVERIYLAIPEADREREAALQDVNGL